METKDIAGALAGGLVAMETIEALVTKGLLTNADAKIIFDNAIKAAARSPVMSQESVAVVRVLESIRKGRFS